ncbi:GtrA family protein [Actinocorallia longicatena]|uniref:GtrA/DPMS transmembrane domain-containing protein n=1 Tax=Actinocorallia longicatena TaxID=111803 RepID=A0ABP6QCH5_9ACTN
MRSKPVRPPVNAAVPPTAAPGAAEAFGRFVAVGVGTTLLASGLLAVASARMDLVAANALITLATTLLATELHGRFSFRSEKGGWRVHAQSALTIAVAYLFTTGAMLVLRRAHPAPDVVLDQVVYLGASGLAGLARFLVLRVFVFGARPVVAAPLPSEVALAA